MSSYTCEFHSEVQNDYSEAYEWYESRKKGLGERFLTFVRRKLIKSQSTLSIME